MRSKNARWRPKFFFHCGVDGWVVITPWFAFEFADYMPLDTELAYWRGIQCVLFRASTPEGEMHPHFTLITDLIRAENKSGKNLTCM